MLVKMCIAAAVALGCILIVPTASIAQDDKDKSAAKELKAGKAAKAPEFTKKSKKGYSDEVHWGIIAPPVATPCHFVREPVTMPNGHVAYREVQVCS